MPESARQGCVCLLSGHGPWYSSLPREARSGLLLDSCSLLGVPSFCAVFRQDLSGHTVPKAPPEFFLPSCVSEHPRYWWAQGGLSSESGWKLPARQWVVELDGQVICLVFLMLTQQALLSRAGPQEPTPWWE